MHSSFETVVRQTLVFAQTVDGKGCIFHVTLPGDDTSHYGFLTPSITISSTLGDDERIFTDENEFVGFMASLNRLDKEVASIKLTLALHG